MPENSLLGKLSLAILATWFAIVGALYLVRMVPRDLQLVSSTGETALIWAGTAIPCCVGIAAALMLILRHEVYKTWQLLQDGGES